MSYMIDFYNRTDDQKIFGLTQIIKYILPIAGEYGGKVYGGFVRDVLVFLEDDKSSKTTKSWKDVDIWFKTQQDADNFVARMGKQIKFDMSSVTIIGNEDFYKWHRSQYSYYHNDILLSWIDIIISKDFPVNDFNVNHLTYQFGCGIRDIYNVPYTISVEGQCNSTIDDLKWYIRNRRLLMKSEYKMLTIDKDSPRYKFCIKPRLERRFYERGWTIDNY
jgi:hypothetical protein